MAIRHSTPLNVHSWIAEGGQNENKEFEKYLSIYNVHAVNSFKYLSDLASVRLLFALNQVTQFINFSTNSHTSFQ